MSSSPPCNIISPTARELSLRRRACRLRAHKVVRAGWRFNAADSQGLPVALHHSASDLAYRLAGRVDVQLAVRGAGQAGRQERAMHP
jgi:hypothetical protein